MRGQSSEETSCQRNSGNEEPQTAREDSGKEYQLYKQRVDAFVRESVILDLHLQHALEKESHLDAELEIDCSSDGVKMEDDRELDEAAHTCKSVERKRWNGKMNPRPYTCEM